MLQKHREAWQIGIVVAKATLNIPNIAEVRTNKAFLLYEVTYIISLLLSLWGIDTNTYYELFSIFLNHRLHPYISSQAVINVYQTN